MSAETLKAKYKPVIDFLSTRGALIHHLHEEAGKLVLNASVHDEAEKNRVWDQIKGVDGNYDDLKAEIKVDA
ncbi:MAG: peptidoglycan-binding protein, partial [Candidatus Hydrogenedentes bacterium]|nr:peptidoglycan-binding protein [Candidatus Hydrogenedentota bacterium]